MAASEQVVRRGIAFLLAHIRFGYLDENLPPTDGFVSYSQSANGKLYQLEIETMVMQKQKPTPF